LVRARILKLKAQTKKLNLPDHLLQTIAAAIDGNVRAMEGIVTRLAAHAKFSPEGITPHVVHQILRPFRTKTKVTMEKIVEAVSSHFRVETKDLLSTRKVRTHTTPRYIALHLCRQLTEKSSEELGHYFGGRSHASVLTALKKAKQQMEVDIELQNDFDVLKKQLMVG